MLPARGWVASLLCIGFSVARDVTTVAPTDRTTLADQSFVTTVAPTDRTTLADQSFAPTTASTADRTTHANQLSGNMELDLVDPKTTALNSSGLFFLIDGTISTCYETVASEPRTLKVALKYPAIVHEVKLYFTAGDMCQIFIKTCFGKASTRCTMPHVRRTVNDDMYELECRIEAPATSIGIRYFCHGQTTLTICAVKAYGNYENVNLVDSMSSARKFLNGSGFSSSIDGNSSTCFETSDETGKKFEVHLVSPAVVGVFRVLVTPGDSCLEFDISSFVPIYNRIICFQTNKTEWIEAFFYSNTPMYSIPIKILHTMSICEIEVYERQRNKSQNFSDRNLYPETPTNYTMVNLVNIRSELSLLMDGNTSTCFKFQPYILRLFHLKLEQLAIVRIVRLFLPPGIRCFDVDISHQGVHKTCDWTCIQTDEAQWFEVKCFHDTLSSSIAIENLHDLEICEVVVFERDDEKSQNVESNRFSASNAVPIAVTCSMLFLIVVTFLALKLKRKSRADAEGHAREEQNESFTESNEHEYSRVNYTELLMSEIIAELKRGNATTSSYESSHRDKRRY